MFEISEIVINIVLVILLIIIIIEKWQRITEILKKKVHLIWPLG